MPSSTNVFGRLAGRRHVEEIHQDHSRPSSPWEERQRSRLSIGHKRNSSLLSVTNSVTDLGYNVRRSVSLRSNQARNSFSGQRSRLSTGNLLDVSSPSSPQSPSEIQPSRPRGKLPFSPKSITRRLKSADTLPSYLGSHQLDGATDYPQTPTFTRSPGSTYGSSMATPSVPKRPPPERPGLSIHQSYPRDQQTSFSGPGAPLQHASTMNTTSTTTSAAGNHSPSAIYQTIHETGSKRMATIEYMRKVHDGNIYYFGTLHHSPTTLSTLPSMHQVKLGRRATNYMVLGYSLPAQLDMNSGSALEYLKALHAVLQEFETYQNLVGFDSSGSSLSRGRVGQMFKSGMGLGNRAGKSRRSSSATDTIASDISKMSVSDASSPQEIPSNPIGHDFDHLLTPHLPFDPDFGTTFATLCDTLMDTYARLLDLVVTPDVCTPGVGDAFAKADKMIRKILVSNVVREFEDSTRSGVKGEVAGLGRLVLGGLV